MYITLAMAVKETVTNEINMVVIICNEAASCSLGIGSMTRWFPAILQRLDPALKCVRDRVGQVRSLL